MRTPLLARTALIVATASVSLSAFAQPASPASPAANVPPPWQRLERYALGFAYTGTQLRDHVYGRATTHFARGDAARDALKSPADVAARQAEIRKFIAETMGGLASL